MRTDKAFITVKKNSEKAFEEFSIMSEEWVEYIDESTGKTYYFNPVTNETCWDFPHPTTTASTIEDSSSSAATEWTEMIDESSGKAYYYNQSTGEVQWDPPENFNAQSSVTADSPNGALVLPENWQEVIDGSTVYYYNSVTGETSWDHPGKNSRSGSPNDELRKQWIEHFDETGRPYYQNVTTNECQWESPFITESTTGIIPIFT